MTNFTRRNMLTGAVGATAAAATAVNFTAPLSADEASDDLASFVKMLSALTGIDEARLAPAVDPVQIKREYLAVAKADRSFDRLMAVFRAEIKTRAAEDDCRHDPLSIRIGHPLSWTQHHIGLVPRGLVQSG